MEGTAVSSSCGRLEPLEGRAANVLMQAARRIAASIPAPSAAAQAAQVDTGDGPAPLNGERLGAQGAAARLEAPAQEEEADELEGPAEDGDVAEDSLHDSREVAHLLPPHPQRRAPEVHPA